MTTIIADRYDLVGELGSGGAGTVFSVIDRQNRTQLALKCLRREKAAADPRLAALFRHEYYTLTQLTHPRIVSVYDYGVCELGAYYTMELIDGLDVREAAPLPAREVCRLLRDVASALAMLHARRLLHRDVSYRNVRCTSTGHAKLFDFGAMTPIGITTKDVIGTPPFIPPESVQGRGLDHRADLYSLGALAYWMLTARHAYPATGLLGLRQLWAAKAPPSPATLVDGVPPELDRLVMALLSHDPQGRPASAGEVMDRLSAIADLPPAEDLRVAEAYLTRPALVGRETELKRIREYLKREPPARRPIWIEAREGLGKTRLLEELVMEAKLTEAVAISVAGKAARSERYGVARGIVDQLVTAIPESIAALQEDDRGLLATEFRALRAGGTPSLAPPAAPSSERSHQLQAAFTRWVSAVTRSRPLLIAVDDFAAVDDDSAALLAALIADRSAPNAALAVTALPTTSNDKPAQRLVRQFANVVQLRPLREADVAQLMREMFGDVPNAGRVAHWMFEQTRGNPLECIELAQYLVERELVHYAEGTWMLPDALPREVPQGLQETRRARLGSLPSTQRMLAEAIAVFAEPVPVELCAELADLDEPATFLALDALVRADLLTLEHGDYVYRSEALREAVYENISPERARSLHEKAGQLLLPRCAGDHRKTICAADHLMRGSSQLQGADQVAASARDPNVPRDVGEFFTPPLERALEIYRSHGKSPADTLPLRARLLNAAFMYDRELVHYAIELLPQLRHDTGLDLMTAAELEQPNWLDRMVERATARFDSEPLSARGLPPSEALVMLSNVAGVTLAAAILKRDPSLIEQVWAVVEPLAKLGSGNGLSIGPELVGLYVQSMRSGDASNHELRAAFVERLRDPSQYPGIADVRRKSILATQLHNIGMATSVLDGDTARALADEIDALGLQMYQGAAMQVRYMVHMYRGEAEAARECHARLDVLALQGGAGTQFELWLAPYQADPYVLWDDVLGLKQCAAHLRRLAETDVGYGAMALIAQGHYERVRGHYPKALAMFEGARGLAPRDRHGSWLLALSGHVDTLVEAGQAAEAFALGAELLDSMHYAPRFTEIIEQRMARSLALAEAQLGRSEAAIQRCARAIERELARGQSPLHLGRLHEVLARIALLQGDAARFAHELNQVRQHFLATRNPVLITRCERLAEAGRAKLETSLAPPSSGDAELRSAVAGLARIEDPAMRAQSALELIQRHVGIDSGFLFLTRGHELELAAPCDGRDSPDGLQAVLTTLMSDMMRAADRTTTLHSRLGGGSETMTLNCGRREFIPLPLGVLIEDRRALIGMVALPVERATMLTAPPWRLLEAVARAFYEAGDVACSDWDGDV
jgi:tetratricopeptide (TPR) repeat protein